MSFYSSNRNVRPGRIEGSPVSGLNQTVCVEVTRVLDSALNRETENVTLPLSNFSIPNPTPPFRFISAKSTQTFGIISNLTIARIEERSCFARIRYDLTIPMRVVFEDANGEEVTAQSQIQTTEDLVMYVPPASIFPFEVRVNASASCINGVFPDNETLTATACMTIITKVVASTDLLMPTYGFCPVPNAIEFEREACDDFYDLPLYPSGK